MYNRAGSIRVIAFAFSCFLFAFLFVAFPATLSFADGGTDVSIHKTLGEGDTPGTPLEGISFEAIPVLDSRASDHDALVAEMKTNPYLHGYQLGTPIKAVSNSQGDALFSRLPDATYLVREIPSRVGDVAYTVISPFLIEVPDMAITRDDGNKSLRVYAKNQPLSIKITPYPSSRVTPGEPVQWDIQANVPAPDVNGSLHTYIVTSKLDSALKYQGVSSVVISDGNSSETLTENIDYIVVFDPNLNTVTIKLTNQGLAKLARMRLSAPQTAVHIKLQSIVDSNVSDEQIIKNTAQLFPDGWADTANVVGAAGTATDVANISVVSQPVVTSPQCPEEGCVCPPTGCTSSAISVILAKTGAYIKEILMCAAILVAIGALFFIVARRKRDNEAQRIQSDRELQIVNEETTEERGDGNAKTQ